MWTQTIITHISTGAFTAGGTDAIDIAKNKLHLSFIDTVLDMRDVAGASWVNMDLTLYCSKYRNCRIRTPQVNTGLTSMGTGYETLFSEQSEIYTVVPNTTPGSTLTTIDIQTKLFWQPKPGNLRVYPVDAQAALMWNTIGIPSIEWRKSARPITSTSTALGGSGAYYQGPVSINEDRRAPVLRLTFPANLATTSMQIGWSAAVSP
jgi:hypothetical protein